MEPFLILFIAVFILFGIIFISYGIFFLITLFRTIKAGERTPPDSFSEIVMIFTEVIYTIVGPAIGFYRFDEYGHEIPFAKQHVLSIILLVIVSSLSYWIARFTTKTANPVFRILVSVGLLQGIILCAVTSIHFLTFIPLGVIYPMMGFELLSPVFALFLLIREFYFYNRVIFNYDDALPYRQELGFVPIPFKIIQAPIFSRIVIYGIMLIPLIVIQMFLAYGCGQDIDAIVKAYTHSVGFVFSY